MRVFSVRHDSNHFAYFLTKLQRDALAFSQFDGRVIGDTWIAPKVSLYKRTRHKLGNFFQFFGGCLICDPTAVNVLGDEYLYPAGELLPLSYGRKRYSVFNATRVIDCLDYRRTEFEGGTMISLARGEVDREKLLFLSLRQGAILEFAFLAEVLPPLGFFKIPNVSWTKLFFADDRSNGDCLLLDVLKQHKLRGLVCEEVFAD